MTSSPSNGSATPAAIPVILDVDTGVDDAMAILLAARHPALSLQAVTCVDGNAPLADVVANTARVLEVLGGDDVLFAAGADRPLIEPRAYAEHVHGADGMGDLGLPTSACTEDDRHAVALLADLLGSAADGAAQDKVTLVSLAPTTNLALLLRTYPEVAQGIREIVLMGGSAQSGNATASAEFNVWHDPEASAIVYAAAGELGIPVRMYGLDVFYDVVVSRAQAEQMRAAGPAADLGGRLALFACDRAGANQAGIGDAGAVCAVIEPAGLRTRTLPVRVELAGTWSRGRTIVDLRDDTDDLGNDPHGPASTSVEVGLDVDGTRYARLWLDTLTGGLR